MKRVFGVVTLLCLVLVSSVSMTPAFATSASGGPGGGPPGDPEAPILIATGPDNSVEGYYETAPDEYGSYGNFGFINGNTSDRFFPTGEFLELTTFTSGLFLFTNGTDRELLSDQQEWQDAIGGDGDLTLTRSVTSANVASDTNSDTVDDTLMSSFRVDGTGTSLAFDLVQNVSSAGPGVAVLRQSYTITNDGGSASTFTLVRATDGDLLWEADFSQDEVLTTMHGAGLGPYVVEQENGIPDVTAITLSSETGRNYYGCKNTADPPGGPPPCGFGTDLQVWDNFGIPTTWENLIINVGYGINGESGTAPGDDAAIGMDWEITLGPGESTEVTMLHTFGQAAPPAGCVLQARARRRARAGRPLPVALSIQHNRPSTVNVPFFIWVEDAQGRVITSLRTENITLRRGDKLERRYKVNLPQSMAPGRYTVYSSVREMQQGSASARQTFFVTR